jgi:Holliday junction resolvase RusA-like endonuclease
MRYCACRDGKKEPVELQFPIEFIVEGTPVSFQARRPESRNEWKARVKAASSTALPHGHRPWESGIAVTMFYFPNETMQGDVDNIVKLVLDALCRHIYVDDSQVERIVVQKFEPGNVFGFASPSPMLEEALNRQQPVLYVRVSDDPFEDLI